MAGPKYIYAITKDGLEEKYAVEDMVSQNLNRFMGWTCNAGIQSLYIDYDGSVWVANCAGAAANPNSKFQFVEKQWGYVGDIFKDTYKWKQSPVICPWSSCGCGADICLSKNSQRTKVPHNQIDNQNKTTSEHKLVAVGMDYHWPKHILWDIGRWCNYSCSYCWPDVHNKTDPHKKLDVMKRVVDRVHNEWASGEMIRWSFGGGEPTVNPDFLPLVEYMKSKGDYVLTVSNGSRNKDYYTKLAAVVDCLQLSVHFEFWKSDVFVENVEAIIAAFVQRGYGWLDIKIMCKPGTVAEGQYWMEEFNSMFESYNKQHRYLGYATCVPIRDLEDSGKMVNYSDLELDLISKW
jgi:hypothetical protein